MTQDQYSATVRKYLQIIANLSEDCANSAGVIADLQAQLKAKDETKPKLEAV